MRKLVLLCAVSLALAGLANAELLIGFNMAGLPGNGPSATSVYNAVNIQAGSLLTRGTGLAPNAATNSFNSSSWTVELTSDDALANGDYLTFTITADAGYQFTITNIEWRFSRSATGPTNMSLRSSLDSFGSDLAVWVYTGTAQINFSNSLSLAASPSVELRLLGYQAGQSTGTARISDGGNFGQAGIDLAVYGEVMPIPEPATVALVGLGMLALAAQRKFRR